MVKNEEILNYLKEIDKEVLTQGKSYYENGCIKKIIEIKEDIYRSIVQLNALENKVTISFKDTLQLNCECQNFRINGYCVHGVASLYYLEEHKEIAPTIFSKAPIDQIIYNADAEVVKSYLINEFQNNPNRQSFIKFLFFLIKEKDLTEADYQYIFDYLYTLSEPNDRTKIIHYIFDGLFDRFRDKLAKNNYKEALLIFRMMVINEEKIKESIEEKLSHYEYHFSNNIIHLKGCLKYLTLYVSSFDELEIGYFSSILNDIVRNPKIYVALYLELKNIIFDYYQEGYRVILPSLKNIYIMLINCSDVCRDVTIELVFKMIESNDLDYEFFKAVYCELLFIRAYAPGNINIDLFEEIKVLNQSSYVNDVNSLVKIVNEKTSQRQLLDLYVHDENWGELGSIASNYPSLKHLFVYHSSLLGIHQESFYDLVKHGLKNYISRFPMFPDAFTTYIYINENDYYFVKLLEIIKSHFPKIEMKALLEQYRDRKYLSISKNLTINRYSEQFYLANFKTKDA